jgi:hypothetical protein
MDTDEGAQEDPLSLHKYLYCKGNPLDNIDPSGHDSLDLVLTVAALQSIDAFPQPAATQALRTIERSGTLWLNIGFDTSVKFDSSTKTFITKCKKLLDNILTENGPKVGILWLGHVQVSYDWKRKQPPKQRQYANDMSPTDFGITGHKGGLNILLTTLKVVSKDGGDDLGRTVSGIITLVNVKLSMEDEYGLEVIAHEAGHYVGYVGDAPGDHSSVESSIMYHYPHSPPYTADHEYVDKITAHAH